MIVTLAVPTLKRYDLLSNLLIASAERNTRPPDRYYVVDNGGGYDPAAYGAPTSKTRVYKPGRNIGVAAAWNHVLTTIDEPVIMACDDMDLWPGTVAAMVEAYKVHEDVDFFFPQHNAHTMFGVYLLRRRVFDKIGMFDEAFSPAYFEDNDYAYRMKLAGIKTMTVPLAGMNHVGSATLKSFSGDEMKQHHASFEALRKLYVRKWGGQPGHEVFTAPYDGKGP